MGIPAETINPQQSLITKILIRRFLHRHPKAWGVAYLAAGCVHMFLGLILTVYGPRWGAGLIAVGALELWAAYRLLSGQPGTRTQ